MRSVTRLRAVIRPLARRLPGLTVSAETAFHYEGYLRLNQRRLEHLASLRLPIGGKTVLEVGAGVGDHTSFFIDRSCIVTATDGRASNIAILQKRYPTVRSFTLDLDHPPAELKEEFDIVYCYGVLYHLEKPAEALGYLASRCRAMLFVETAVSFGEEEELHPLGEPKTDPSQAVSGRGCRPTRSWVFARLLRLFPHVYVPATQPAHAEFPTDWTGRPPTDLSRAVFLASRSPLVDGIFLDYLPQSQTRCAA